MKLQLRRGASRQTTAGAVRRHGCRRPWARTLQRAMFALALLGLPSLGTSAFADESPEYRLKAAFLYNFVLFTEWPGGTAATLHLCVVGQDPFGSEIDVLEGKKAGGRAITVVRKAAGAALGECDIVFIAASAIGTLPRVLEGLHGRPVLTVADSAGAARRGITLNLTVSQDKVGFEANLQAARGAGLVLSSKLLRLASEVYQ
jgi:hypothetical protein